MSERWRAPVRRTCLGELVKSITGLANDVALQCREGKDEGARVVDREVDLLELNQNMCIAMCMERESSVLTESSTCGSTSFFLLDMA